MPDQRSRPLDPDPAVLKAALVKLLDVAEDQPTEDMALPQLYAPWVTVWVETEKVMREYGDRHDFAQSIWKLDGILEDEPDRLVPLLREHEELRGCADYVIERLADLLASVDQEVPE